MTREYEALTARGDVSAPDAVNLREPARSTRTLGRLIWGRSRPGEKIGCPAEPEPEPEIEASGAAEAVSRPFDALDPTVVCAATSSSSTAVSSTFGRRGLPGESPRGDAVDERVWGLGFGLRYLQTSSCRRERPHSDRIMEDTNAKFAHMYRRKESDL